MVKHPDFRITANDKDVTEQMREYLIGIDYTDDIDNEADGFAIKFQGESFMPPSFKDVLKVWIGYRGNLWYIGSFSVLKSRLEYETMEVEVTATPVDFGSDIKEKRTTSYDNATLQQILEKIAARHGLSIITTPIKYLNIKPYFGMLRHGKSRCTETVTGNIARAS